MWKPSEKQRQPPEEQSTENNQGDTTQASQNKQHANATSIVQLANPGGHGATASISGGARDNIRITAIIR